MALGSIITGPAERTFEERIKDCYKSYYVDDKSFYEGSLRHLLNALYASESKSTSVQGIVAPSWDDMQRGLTHG